SPVPSPGGPVCSSKAVEIAVTNATAKQRMNSPPFFHNVSAVRTAPEVWNHSYIAAEVPISALGHKRTLQLLIATSALPPAKADIGRWFRNIR
ncbi:MAG TPA: hypothetical protein VHT68_20050, partial [Pseudolabrys sp.]|nr:hypothetical protein [Pseudolabrys sp.]